MIRRAGVTTLDNARRVDGGRPGGRSRFPASAAPMAYGIGDRGRNGARVPDSAYRPILRAWRPIGGVVPGIAATRTVMGAR